MVYLDLIPWKQTAYWQPLSDTSCTAMTAPYSPFTAWDIVPVDANAVPDHSIRYVPVMLACTR